MLKIFIRKNLKFRIQLKQSFSEYNIFSIFRKENYSHRQSKGYIKYILLIKEINNKILNFKKINEKIVIFSQKT